MFSHTQPKQRPGDINPSKQVETHTIKEVQLEHPTPINQLSKQIHIRPSIVAVLRNSHLGKQHKSSNYIPPPGHVCVCVRAHTGGGHTLAQKLGCYDCGAVGKIV